jgi:hypothetical protein
VINRVLQRLAGVCKSPIPKPDFFSALLRVAPYCARGGVRVVRILDRCNPPTVTYDKLRILAYEPRKRGTGRSQEARATGW